MPSGINKYSITINGHKTSIALEKDFFDELKKIAKNKKMSLNTLVTEIDQTKDNNLSSALRLYVLKDLKEKVEKNETNYAD